MSAPVLQSSLIVESDWLVLGIDDIGQSDQRAAQEVGRALFRAEIERLLLGRAKRYEPRAEGKLLALVAGQFARRFGFELGIVIHHEHRSVLLG